MSSPLSFAASIATTHGSRGDPPKGGVLRRGTSMRERREKLAWLAALPPPVACALLGSVTSIDVPESSRLEAVESAAGCRTGVWPVPFSLPIAGWIYCGEAVRGADALAPDGDELWLIGTRRASRWRRGRLTVGLVSKEATVQRGFGRRLIPRARSRTSKFGAVAGHLNARRRRHVPSAPAEHWYPRCERLPSTDKAAIDPFARYDFSPLLLQLARSLARSLARQLSARAKSDEMFRLTKPAIITPIGANFKIAASIPQPWPSQSRRERAHRGRARGLEFLNRRCCRRPSSSGRRARSRPPSPRASSPSGRTSSATPAARSRSVASAETSTSTGPTLR